MTTREHVINWLTRLKEAWEGGDADAAVSLFEHTHHYYERPFKAGTTREEIEGYWRDIDGLEDVTFEFEVPAIEGDLAVVRWQNGFRTSDGKTWLLDGVFFVEFDSSGNCVTFRQWWFSKD